MPKLVHRLPVIRHHTPSNRARVRIDGKEFWLGEYGSQAAQCEYDKLISGWLANGRRLPSEVEKSFPVVDHVVVSSPDTDHVTISTLIEEFSGWSIRHYVSSDGAQTREHANFVNVFNTLLKMYGELPAASFGPLCLIALRDELIGRNLARRTINAMLRRTRQVFRWGVSRELISVDVLTRLTTVEPLQPNRGGRETRGTRGSVSWEVVAKTLPHLPPFLAAFATVLYYSGARCGEAARLTTRMIDTSRQPWVANLDRHKTAYKGKSRTIYLGPVAQAALSPYLSEKQPDEPIFSPSQEGKHTYRNRSSLSQLLRRAIKRGGGESWTLAQLRHSCAVRVKDNFDIETARELLGHTQVSMTRHYSQDSQEACEKAARQLG